MMSDQFRKVEPYSPKSSPRGARSPVVSRQDSSGTLKTTISLGKNPSIVHSGPFYLMKEPPAECEQTGATNLMAYYGLEHSYSKFNGKKLKESLSSFLPNLPGILDGPGQEDNSTLGSVIAKRPIGGKELLPLTSAQLAGFRLHPGPLPEQYRYVSAAPPKKHKANKHKKHKHKDGAPPGQDTPLQDSSNPDTYEKKHKKQKRHDDDKERKKRKKEKKRKKQKHSPEHGGLTPNQHPVP
ncbi:mediator of RNA polymerase II transcription subunit 19 [Maniola hyperantus]|uniref:mediator of RNA polymerase II transcription subunit 19 n=1 Tax=Aphantopus hyperantus TaxID=2795564 RepID=UPI0015684C9F|nr:mediator of RNA polymerase II transcription subunit 19 [Maniola hyperantus]